MTHSCPNCPADVIAARQAPFGFGRVERLAPLMLLVAEMNRSPNSFFETGSYPTDAARVGRSDDVASMPLV
jgi:hypothetical protein